MKPKREELINTTYNSNCPSCVSKSQHLDDKERDKYHPGDAPGLSGRCGLDARDSPLKQARLKLQAECKK